MHRRNYVWLTENQAFSDAKWSAKMMLLSLGQVPYSVGCHHPLNQPAPQEAVFRVPGALWRLASGLQESHREAVRETDGLTVHGTHSLCLHGAHVHTSGIEYKVSGNCLFWGISLSNRGILIQGRGIFSGKY